MTRSIAVVTMLIGLLAGVVVGQGLLLMGAGQAAYAQGEGVPAILFVTAGACPAGYTEVSAASGRAILGTSAGPSATLTHGVTQPNAHTLSGSSEAVTGGTPAGTVAAPTFTGTQGDNRQAFIRMIPCSKN